ncbi:MAG: hypothetical protein AAFY41_11705 [Bacteroidota bacterium]
MNKTQKLIALVIVSLIGICGVYIDTSNQLSSKLEDKKPDQRKAKHGEFKKYTSDKKLKTIVNYDNGTKHGFSYLYHNDGKTVLLAMPYQNGKREGISKKYFESGVLYASTSYKNDLLHGPRKTYYSSGKLKSVLNYGSGKVGLGTKEYLLDGQLKETPRILSKRDRSRIWLDTSVSCKNTVFYIGKLVDDVFFDPLDNNVKQLMDDNGVFFIDTEVYTRSYLKYQDIICSCKTSQGNPLIIKTKVDHL